MSAHESVRDLPLDRLVEGRDLARWRKEARQFLFDLTEALPAESFCVVLPVARRLVGIKGWQQRISVDAVRDYCLPRLHICQTLAAWREHNDECPEEYRLAEGIDPEIEYMIGMVTDLQDKLWSDNEHEAKVQAQ